MNPGVLKKTAAGRILLDTAPSVIHFNAGTPANNVGALCTSSGAIQTYYAGLPYDAAGALCIAVADALVTGLSGGIALSGGRVAVTANGAIHSYFNGFPVDAQGRLCVDFNIDPLAEAWEDAVIANGGTTSLATVVAVSTFIMSAKSKGYWDRLLRLNLFAGDQLAAALVPQKALVGTPLDIVVAFVAADYTQATGLTGNGTTKWLRTGVNANALTLNDTHLSVYNRSNTAAGGGRHMGVQVGNDITALAAPLSNNNVISNMYDISTGQLFAALTPRPYGHIIGTRVAANDHKIFRNGAQFAANVTGSGVLVAFPIAVFALGNNAGGAGSFVSHTLAAYSIGLGLTPTMAADYYADMQAFQTALGRQV